MLCAVVHGVFSLATVRSLYIDSNIRTSSIKRLRHNHACLLGRHRYDRASGGGGGAAAADAHSTHSTTLFLFSSDQLDDPTFYGASLLWGLNLYLGFDWFLAPLGLDNDFNPATRTTVALGRLLAGRGLNAAFTKPIVDTDGERPELGTRIGTGANSAYAVAVLENGENDSDWLTDREAGLSSTPPWYLRVVVLLFYVLLGVAVTSVTDRESFLTAAVFFVISCVYEIGRPTLPTREEALADAKLERAVADFVEKRVLIYGEESSSPVRMDEAVNERELVKAFRDDMGREVEEFPDFQIELLFRSYGTGRSLAGYVKGLRLLKKEKAAIVREE